MDFAASWFSTSFGPKSRMPFYNSNVEYSSAESAFRPLWSQIIKYTTFSTLNLRRTKIEGIENGTVIEVQIDIVYILSRS